MPKRGILLYRCRRCGEIIEFAEVSHLPAAMKAMTLTGSARDKVGRDQPIMRPHTCHDGQVGLTDVIGGEYLDSEKDDIN